MGEMLEVFLLFQQERAGVTAGRAGGNEDTLFPACSGALELAACGLNVVKWPKSLGCFPGQWLYKGGCL